MKDFEMIYIFVLSITVSKTNQKKKKKKVLFRMLLISIYIAPVTYRLVLKSENNIETLL